MTPERLTEIRTAAARWTPPQLADASQTSIIRHRAELLAEVQRLTERVERDGKTMQDQALIIARRDTEIAELRAFGESPRTEGTPR